MKTCPYCAEEIQDLAVVCKHCGRDLVAVHGPAHPVAVSPGTSVKKRKRPSCLLVGCAGLIALGGIGYLGGKLMELGQRANRTVAPARDPSDGKSILYALEDSVDVHSAPSEQAPVVRTLALADRVVSVARQGPWVRLSGDTPQWVEGKRLGSRRPMSREERVKRTAAIVGELRTVPTAEVERNHKLYSELVTLNPDNAIYAQKLASYAERLEALRAKERAEQARKEEESRQRIVRFGAQPEQRPWNKSYRVIEEFLESTAHDPDSIEIDACTEVFYTENGWLVGCKYRGRNSFGAKILKFNWFTIAHRKVVAMHEEDAYKR